MPWQSQEGWGRRAEPGLNPPPAPSTSAPGARSPPVPAPRGGGARAGPGGAQRASLAEIWGRRCRGEPGLDRFCFHPKPWQTGCETQRLLERARLLLAPPVSSGHTHTQTHKKKPHRSRLKRRSGGFERRHRSGPGFSRGARCPGLNPRRPNGTRRTAAGTGSSPGVCGELGGWGRAPHPTQAPARVSDLVLVIVAAGRAAPGRKRLALWQLSQQKQGRWISQAPNLEQSPDFHLRGLVRSAEGQIGGFCVSFVFFLFFFVLGRGREIF